VLPFGLFPGYWLLSGVSGGSFCNTGYPLHKFFWFLGVFVILRFFGDPPFFSTEAGVS
jgi:hypothetical protein